MAAERGFDTSAFFPGYLDAFRGPDGGIYGFPKDGNTLGMAYNTDHARGRRHPRRRPTGRSSRPRPTALTTGDQKAFCLNHCLDRALAFIYQNGGSLFNEDKTQNTFDSPETRGGAPRPTSAGSPTGRAPAPPTSATTGAASPSARARSP